MDNLEEMEKFLEKYDFPKLNQEEVEDLNTPITSKEIETVIRNLPENKKFFKKLFHLALLRLCCSTQDPVS